MDKAQLFKEISLCIFLGGVPLAWLCSLSLSTWKEYHRHIEISSAIEFLIAEKRETAAFAVKAVSALSRQKSLIVLRDDDGNLTVQALNTAGNEEVKKELDRQDQKQANNQKNN